MTTVSRSRVNSNCASKRFRHLIRWLDVAPPSVDGFARSISKRNTDVLTSLCCALDYTDIQGGSYNVNHGPRSFLTSSLHQILIDFWHRCNNVVLFMKETKEPGPSLTCYYTPPHDISLQKPTPVFHKIV